MFAEDVHLTLAWTTAVAMTVVALEACVRMVRGRRPGRFAQVGLGLALVLIGMSVAAGLAMLVRGGRPRESLHYLYAILAFGLVPIADTFAVRAPARWKGLARLAGALVALGVIARLFATG